MDADSNKGRIKLQFVKESTRKPYEFTDTSYKPYFYVPSDIRGEHVEKTDLLTNSKITLTRIPGGDSAGFPKRWEDDLSPEMSCVYDKGLHFSLPHVRTDMGFRPVFEDAKGLGGRFDQAFRDVATKDALKFQMLSEFFRVANQPLPEFMLSLPFFGGKSREAVLASILLSRIANIPLPGAAKSRNVSFWIKSMLNSYYRAHNILIPSTEDLRKGDQRNSVQGALTVAPQSGTYFDMVVLDFESLYPGCMDVFNLSYETVNCTHESCRTNKVPGLDVYVCKERRGIYSTMIGALRELRIHWYKPISREASLTAAEKEQAEAAAKILKLILVACYGVTVRIHGLASPLLAEAITAYGRYILSSTWQTAEKLGLKPRYGDTDSIFLDSPTQDEIGLLIRTVKEQFGLDLAVEKSFSLCVLSSAMKAYFGILTDGTPDIKGLSVIKSNSPPLFQKIFNQCVSELASVRDADGLDRARKRILQIYENAVSTLRDRKCELSDLVYTVEIHEAPEEKFSSKVIPQAYQAAMILRDSGVLVKEWDEVRFIKVKPFRRAGHTFSVKPADLVALSEVNVEDYVRTLRLALGQVFEPMGIGFDKKSERTLADFV